MNKSLRLVLICTGITVVTAIYTAMVYPQLPTNIPVHFNINGVADRYEHKSSGAFLMLWIMFGLTALFAALPLLSPKTKPIEPFRASYDAICCAVLGFMAVIQVAMLNATTAHFNINLWITVAMCGLIAVLGNLMGKVTPNYFVGIRTPWTLESETVWERTHRLAAKLMVGASICGIVAAVFGVPMMLIIGFVVLAVLVPVPYSYWLYREQFKATS